MKGGLGWHPERGEVARKLKSAARRPAAGVPGGGPQGGERAPRARTDAAAGGGHGPESRPPLLLSLRLPQPPWHQCGRGLEPLRLGAYELHQVRPSTSWRPSAGSWRRGARRGDPLSSLPSALLPSNVQLRSGVEHPRRAPGSCCFHVERAIQGPEVGWNLPGPTCAPEVRSPGLGLGLRVPLPSIVPAECLRSWAMGSGAQRNVDSSLPGPRLPVKL